MPTQSVDLMELWASNSGGAEVNMREPSVHFGGRDTNGMVFLTSVDDQLCERILPCLGGSQCKVVRDLDGLLLTAGRCLLSFGTSVVVPAGVLGMFRGGAYNVHGASPEFPGRDPHHWAVYAGAKRFGATAHAMTAKVDDGPIVDVEMFDVEEGYTPADLLNRANEAALRVIERIGPVLARGDRPPELAGVSWTGTKRSRADFHRMCKIRPDISSEEFGRIFQAFDGGQHNNLTVEIHGRRFRIEK